MSQYQPFSFKPPQHPKSASSHIHAHPYAHMQTPYKYTYALKVFPPKIHTIKGKEKKTKTTKGDQFSKTQFSNKYQDLVSFILFAQRSYFK